MKKRVIQFEDDEAVALTNFLSVLIGYMENNPKNEIRVVIKGIEKICAELESGATTLHLQQDMCDALVGAVGWFYVKVAPVTLASPNLTGNARKMYMHHYNQVPNILKKLQD